jgi:hypothetical protein
MPNTVVNSIPMIVEVAAGEDFELAGLTTPFLNPIFDAIGSTAPTGQNNLPNPVFQAGDYTSANEASPHSSSQPGTIGSSDVVSDGHESSRLCIGEKVLSIRQICKRSTCFATMSNPSGTPALNQVSVNPFSITYPGLGETINVAGANSAPIDYVDRYGVLYAFMRGSMRMKIHTNSITSVRATTQSGLSNVAALVPRKFPPAGVTFSRGNNFPAFISNEPQVPLEIQVPFYNGSYCTAITPARVGGLVTPLPPAKTTPNTILTLLWRAPGNGSDPNIDTIFVNRQIADDFSFGFFTGTVPLVPNQTYNGPGIPIQEI